MFVVNPTLAVAMLVLGVLAVACEFLRPGLVLPAVAGSLSLVFGIHSLLQRPPDWNTQWPAILGMTLPLVFVLAFLLFAAHRARRNKRLTIF